MVQPEQKHVSPIVVTPVSLLVDAILVVGFFLYMYSVLKIHVPSNDPGYVLFWGCAASACMSGVFWLAVQMFRVVFRAHRLAIASKK